MSRKSNVVTVRLTDEQMKFFTEWKEKLEGELGIDVPLGAVLRRALDGAIHRANQAREHDVRAENNTDERASRTEAANAYISDYKEGK
ncbi:MULTISPECIES: hypothetical protein [Kosakonia]|uniref:CopG family transcriptional regulator n=1 Tax=Kosakonia sacchari TaxID=1158459 RepID=A0ABZ0MV83_9ENTR|nr:hypothetical protein [Kosakonia sacchari]WOZ79422.1 hypothetical protein Q8Y70_10360 [Kosakonia sacchari]